MRLKGYSDGTVLIKIEDEDEYDVTDDNGVDFWLSKDDVSKLKLHLEKFSQQPEIHPNIEQCMSFTISLCEYFELAERMLCEMCGKGCDKCLIKNGCRDNPTISQ